MERTIRALTDLSAVDDQLSRREALKESGVRALEGRRAVLREAIPSVLLAAYDALGRVSRRPVVVAVRGRHCSGCYLRLPSQLDSTIRRRQSLYSCPNCGRLLYWSPRAPEGESATGSSNEIGDRLAGKVRKSKRPRAITGRRTARPKALASKR